MTHQTNFTLGTDARNHIVRCSCGWAFSGTYIAIRDRANIHRYAFKDEYRKWNDPQRRTEMPPSFARTEARAA